MKARSGGRDDGATYGPLPVPAALGSPVSAPSTEREPDFPRAESVVESNHQPCSHGTGGQNADS